MKCEVGQVAMKSDWAEMRSWSWSNWAGRQGGWEALSIHKEPEQPRPVSQWRAVSAWPRREARGLSVELEEPPLRVGGAGDTGRGVATEHP